MTKPICFLDLDGVLVDFVGGALKLHGKELPHHETSWDFMAQLGIGPEAFWSPMGEDFWANLEPTPEMPHIVELVESHFNRDVYLCTSPCQTPGCTTGKARWVEKHLPNYRRKLILLGGKDLFAGPNRVLIDDHDKNVEAWRLAGGMAVLVPRPWNLHRNSQVRVIDHLAFMLGALLS